MNAKQHNKVLEHFRMRAENYGLKPGTKRYFDAQAHFFCGAMAAEVSLIEGAQVDPTIAFSLMRGVIMTARDEAEEKKAAKKTKKAKGE